MQWKTYFCAVMMLSPISLLAQNNKAPENRQIAMAMEESSKEVDIVLNSGSKIVKPDSLVSAQVQQIQQIVSGDLEQKSSKFKHVPLLGELDYYGNVNNDYLINYVEKYMNNFAGRIGKNTSKEKIFAVMESILEKYDIPQELKYLAVIESALNGNARSPVGATGYWQFMAPTARYMGLTVNRSRDDRKDLHKSTHAAAKYLSYLYEQLDDWLLVIAAYNSGPRPVLNGIKRTGESDFWSIKKYLPRETQNHVLAFIATATIMERLNDYIEPGLPPDFDWSTLNTDSRSRTIANKKFQHPLLERFSEDEVKKMAIVRIVAPMDFKRIASVLSIDHRLLGRWNYDYFEFVETYKAGSTYNLRIPKDKLDEFIEKKTFIERTSTL